jgi:hypothetical protein
VIAFEYIPEPSFVQPVTVVNPLMMGLAPEPYEEITIGLDNVPDRVGVMVPENTSPFLNKTESPADRLLKMEFNLVIVFQGVAGLCA